MTSPNRLPLWQVSMNAGDPPCPTQEMAAAEIRALLTAEADRAERGDCVD